VADPAEVPATAPAEASDGAAATVDVETDAVVETHAVAETKVDGAAETTVDGAAAELPGRAPIGEPGPDPVALTRAVEAAVATGDAAIVHTAVLDAVAALRRGGLLDAAIDACQLGLTVAPADPGLHLALAELDLDHGWVAAAVDKLLILERYVILIGDGPTRERLHELAAERIPDDPRLSALRA
jgi:hypothetical protein